MNSTEERALPPEKRISEEPCSSANEAPVAMISALLRLGSRSMTALILLFGLVVAAADFVCACIGNIMQRQQQNRSSIFPNRFIYIRGKPLHVALQSIWRCRSDVESATGFFRSLLIADQRQGRMATNQSARRVVRCGCHGLSILIVITPPKVFRTFLVFSLVAVRAFSEYM